MMGIDRNITVEGYDGFIFTAKTGRPLQPSAVNNILYNIVKAYNKDELKKAKKEHRKAELLPKFSAHVLRHTACTRMAEKGMDINCLLYTSAGGILTTDRLILAITVLPQMNMVHGCLQTVF